jgi:hypothetical protein
MENMGSDSPSDQSARENCAEMISISRNILQAKDAEIAALKNQVIKLTKILDTVDNVLNALVVVVLLKPVGRIKRDIQVLRGKRSGRHGK